MGAKLVVGFSSRLQNPKHDSDGQDHAETVQVQLLTEEQAIDWWA
jgi:hypothetical protein